MVIGPDGEVVVRANDLDPERLTADLELSAVAAARRPFAHARDEDPHLLARELARLAGERG